MVPTVFAPGAFALGANRLFNSGLIDWCATQFAAKPCGARGLEGWQRLIPGLVDARTRNVIALRRESPA